MSINDSIREYLRSKSQGAKATDISVGTGEKRSSVSKTLSRMEASGEVRKTGLLYSLNPDVMRDPNPERGGLGRAGVRRDTEVAAWTPGIDYDQNGGELRTPARPVLREVAAEAQDPDEAELFAEFGLDPQKWQITNLRRSRWESGVSGNWLEAYRASFAPRSVLASAPISDELMRDFLATYGGPETVYGSNETWMVPVGDLQLGKPDGGGTEGIVERFARCTEAVRRDLEARGGVDRLILPWLGDCIEGIVSQGGRNVARLDRTITEQVRILRRLTLHQIGTLAPLANRVLVVAVPGNHDETTRDQNMEPRDSWAVDATSAVADALALSSDFGHVDFLFPEPEELGATVNVGTADKPYVVHFTHGHSARNPDKMAAWWANQAHGRQEAGAADLLVTAHFHHFRLEQTGGGRTWLQIPALDGGSDYFRRRSGEDSPAGMVQMRLTGTAAGWADLTIHG